jgi:D-alanyl-D-alanine carboxypeptidase (penicillin-binding protein 5/6)
MAVVGTVALTCGGVGAAPGGVRVASAAEVPEREVSPRSSPVPVSSPVVAPARPVTGTPFPTSPLPSSPFPAPPSPLGSTAGTAGGGGTPVSVAQTGAAGTNRTNRTGRRHASGGHRKATGRGASAGKATGRRSAANESPSRVQATAGYLLDDTTGLTLWERRPDQRRAIGSIAKVMTALVVLRAGDLDRLITVRKRHRRCVAFGGTHAGLRPGETLTARALLSGMLLPSGCDAAHALAASYGPGPRPFVRKMNVLAAGLGMAGTRFANPDGMPQPREAISTARDVIRLGRVALGNDLLRQIVGRRVVRLPAGTGHRAHTWWSTNELLGRRPGVIGIKTGYTNAAGGCVLFAATWKTRTFVGVVMNSPIRSRFLMVARVLDWAVRDR